MKIGILEVCSKNHVCMIENWIRVAQKNKWEIVVYTTKEFKLELDVDLHHYEKLKIEITTKTIKQFFNYIEEQSSTLDYLVITSLQAHFLEFFFFRPKCKIHLSIHNVNTWFVKKSVSNLKSLIKKIVREYYKRKVDAYIVNSDSMLQYVKMKVTLDKTMYVVSFSMKQKPLQKKSKSKKLSIVYPGMVSSFRKDYDLFLKLAQDYTDYDFILLGKVNYSEGGKEIINRIKSMNLNNMYYFEEYISQSKYDIYMKEADILFSYINVNYENSDYSEVYGVTKDTGVSYLMLEYCLPLLVNSEFSNFSDLDAVTFSYEDYISLKSNMDELTNNILLNNSLESEIYNIRKNLVLIFFRKK